jgi:hypothetical protein
VSPLPVKRPLPRTAHSRSLITGQPTKKKSQPKHRNFPLGRFEVLLVKVVSSYIFPYFSVQDRRTNADQRMMAKRFLDQPDNWNAHCVEALRRRGLELALDHVAEIACVVAVLELRA